MDGVSYLIQMGIVRLKDEYHIVRNFIYQTQKQPFRSLFDKGIMEAFRSSGLISCLCGGFIAFKHEGGAHVVMFVMCNESILFCDSQWGRCERDPVAPVCVNFVFAPKHGHKQMD